MKQETSALHGVVRDSLLIIFVWVSSHSAAHKAGDNYVSAINADPGGGAGL